jgi:hypothetical protein
MSMTPEAKQTTAPLLTVQLLLVGIGALGVIGIMLAFVFVDASTNQVEAWLLRRWPASQPDAFAGLNGTMNPWIVSLWICWCVLVPACLISRRFVSLFALIVAPTMAAGALLIFDFDFADPYWVMLFGVTTIGVFVGTISGLALLLLPPQQQVIRIR